MRRLGKLLVYVWQDVGLAHRFCYHHDGGTRKLIETSSYQWVRQLSSKVPFQAEAEPLKVSRCRSRLSLDH